MFNSTVSDEDGDLIQYKGLTVAANQAMDSRKLSKVLFIEFCCSAALFWKYKSVIAVLLISQSYRINFLDQIAGTG